MQGLYQKHIHNFRLWKKKHVQSFKKIGIKLYEELCSRGTHCLYIEGEKRLSSRYWHKTVRGVALTRGTHCPYVDGEKD